MTAAMDDWNEITGADDEPDYSSEPPDLPAVELEALGLANWHMREIDRIRRQKTELVSLFAAELARLKIRLEDRLSVLTGEERWHSIPVLNLHRALLAKDAKRKTITLASGTMKAVAQQPEWLYHEPGVVPDDDVPENTEAFVAWATEHHPDLIGPRVVGIKVTQEQLQPLLEALMTLDAVPAEALAVSPPIPAKNVVKKVLVKKDEKGKVLVLGVDPETDELPPGLTVKTREPKYSLITDDDVADAEIMEEAADE